MLVQTRVPCAPVPQQCHAHLLTGSSLLCPPTPPKCSPQHSLTCPRCATTLPHMPPGSDLHMRKPCLHPTWVWRDCPAARRAGGECCPRRQHAGIRLLGEAPPLHGCSGEACMLCACNNAACMRMHQADGSHASMHNIGLDWWQSHTSPPRWALEPPLMFLPCIALKPATAEAGARPGYPADGQQPG